MVLLDEKGVLRVTYEEDHRMQVHEWLDYNPEDRDELVLRLLDQIYQLLIDFPVTKLLVKTGEARGAFSPAVQTFIREVQFPRIAADTSIRFVATVKSEGDLSTIGTELWKAHLAQHSPLIMQDAESESDARSWLDHVEGLSNERQ